MESKTVDQDKKSLKAGDLIVTPCFSYADPRTGLAVIYSYDSQAIRYTRRYICDKNYTYKQRQYYLKNSFLWCFRIKENHLDKGLVEVTCFDHHKKPLSIPQYTWKKRNFRFGRIVLDYRDIWIPQEPVCQDCHNYCSQTCRKDLVIIHENV